MLWLFYALISRTCYAICNLLDAHFTSGEIRDPFSRIFLFNLYLLILLVVAFFVFNFSLPPAHLVPWIIACGASFFFYIIPYLKALQISDTSTVVSLFTISRVVVPFLAYIFIGEVLTTNEIIGFVVVLAGSLWHAYEPKKARINSKLVCLMALCGFLIAAYSTFAKPVFTELHWIDGLFYVYLTSILFSFSILLVPSLRPEIVSSIKYFPKYVLPYSPIIFFSMLANATHFFAIALTKVTYATMVGQFQAFFVLVLSTLAAKLGYIRIQEDLSPRAVAQKISGFVVMALGMWIALK